MKIILNHTLRSIRSNLGQLAVIIFTVTVVTTLFFASLSLGDLFYNFQVEGFSRLSGEAEISVSGDVFSEEKFNEFIVDNQNEIEYVDKYLQMAGLLNTDGEEYVEAKSTVILIEATDVKEFLSKHKDRLFYYDGIEKDAEYVYPGLWISKGFAEKNGYEVGEVVDVYVSMYGRYQKFTVTYIFEEKGVFANSTIYNVITDVKELGEKGLYTTAYIKLKDNVNENEFISKLQKFFENSNLTIEYAVDYEYVDNLVSNNENLLNVALIFICALVIFILLGAYKVVMQNRADEMIVFKSAGATPLQTVFILLLEGVLYGIIGAVIGVIVGRFCMEIIVNSVIPSFASAVKYEVSDYIVSFILGILISVISALFPVIKLTNETVRKLNSGSIKFLRKPKMVFALIPLVIMGVSVGIILTVPSLVVVFTIVLIISVVALVLMLTPYLADGACKAFGLIKSAKMASWGIKRNSDTATLSGLIGAIVAFTFIAVSIVNIIIQATTTYNERFSCDYVIESIDESFNGNEIDTLVGNTYGVEYSRLFEYHQFYINYNGEEKDSYIYRVENSKSLDSAVFGLTKEEKEAFDNIDNGAIFSYDLINRYGFEVGDSAEIEIDGIKYKFIICGVDNSLTKNDRVIYVNEKFNQIEFEKFMILMGASKNVSNSDLYVELRDKLENYGCYVLEYRDWAYATAVGINGLAILLRSLEVLIAIVGILGVINMSIAMFIKRKREFEIYRAVGIDRKKYTVYTFFEGLIIATIGGIIGLVFSFVINLLMPDFAVMIDRHTVIDFFPYQILIITAICVVAYTVCYMTIATRFRPEKNTINRNQA